ncbi:hypothetical protein J577_0655 [Acinetobacter sp. 263903-1]|nr:hypothetical protein J577_0655 [Acinetobacter sp. 263903-1]
MGSNGITEFQGKHLKCERVTKKIPFSSYALSLHLGFSSDKFK